MEYQDRMTIEEAIRDPKRPLSISPRDWVLSVEAELEEEKELVEGSVERLISSKTSSKEISPWEKIDLGLDEMIEGAKILDSGIFSLHSQNLKPEERILLSKIKETWEGGVLPYLSELLTLSESGEKIR